MKRLILIFSVLVNLIAVSHGQSVIRTRNFGGSDMDEGRSIIQLESNRFLIGAFSQSNNHDRFGNHIGPYPGTADIWLYEVDSLFNFQFQKSFGGTEDDRISALVTSNDHRFFLAGTTSSNDSDVSGNHSLGGSDIWLVRVDTDYSIMWQKCLGGTGLDEGTGVFATNDGGCIVTGKVQCCGAYVSNFHGGIYDGFVCKLDSLGQLQWWKTIGGSSDDQCTDVVQCSDGSFLVLGITSSNDSDITNSFGSEDAFVFKYDINGNLLWKKFYGGSSGDDALRIINTSDGGFIFVGGSGSSDGDVSGSNGGGDAWVVKADSSGTIQWHKRFGGPSQEWASSISRTNDGGYIIGGVSFANGGIVVNNHGALDFFLIKIDSLGGYEWSYSYGGFGFDQLYSSIQTIQGNYLSIGYSDGPGGDVNNNYGDRDVWLVETSPLQVGVGNLSNDRFSLEGNLVGNNLVLDYSGNEVKNINLKLFSVTGQLMESKTTVLVFGVNVISLTNTLPAGIYLMDVEFLNGKITRRLVNVN